MKVYYISTIVANYFRDCYPNLVKFSRKIQKFLWYIGIAIYNPITDEDTPDFNSNADYKNSRFCFIRKSKEHNANYWINFTDYRDYKNYIKEYSDNLYCYIKELESNGYKFTSKDIQNIVKSSMLDANAAELNKFDKYNLQNYLKGYGTI